MSASPWSLTARWIFPVDGPPLERGILTIAGDRIAAVGPHGTRTADRDLGNVAILPGLVNAHTHLDLSGMGGKCPPTPDFTDWLRKVIQYRLRSTPEQKDRDIRRGLEESIQFGTALLSDVASEGRSWDALGTAALRAVVYYELLGLPSDRASQAWSKFKKWKNHLTPAANCRVGVSPHAPYSVNGKFIGAVAWDDYPMTIHLAETQAEMELLEERTGPFVPFLEELGVWVSDCLAPSVNWIVWNTRLASSILYAHCNYLPLNVVIGEQGTIVYCPRTHAAFGHPPHPFREFLARGVRVALGTDSLASNPDLDVLAEARFVHAKHPDVAGDVLLRMVTLSGAEALGWENETGSLTPGKSADFILLPLPNEEKRDPHLLVLESAQAISSVVFRGQLVHGVLG
jgi:cytosine/adenosine deaminase-related metal-dependent hydrolase